MRAFLVVAALAIGLIAGDPPKVTLKENVIPAEARKIAADLWLWTDARGERWLFQQTRYGMARMELQPIVVSEHGDTVSFSQLTPFGVMRSEKKKGDLNETERRLYDDYLKAIAAAKK